MDKKKYHKEWRNNNPDYHKKWQEENSERKALYAANKKEYRRKMKEEGKCISCKQINDRKNKCYCTNCKNLRIDKYYKNEKSKEYQKIYQKEFRKISKQKFRKFLDTIKIHYKCLNPMCLWAGDIKPCQLDFHHLKDKKFNIASTKTKMKLMILEMNKCTIVCACCHRLITWDNLDTSNFKTCNIDENGNPI